MSAQRIEKVNTHVVDILGNVKGRDQPIMLMSKAHELVSTLSPELFLDDEVVFFDPFCKAGEILLAAAFNTCIQKSKKVGKVLEVSEVQRELYQSKRYYALAPDERHHRLSLRTFLGNEKSHKEEFNHIIKNGNYLSEIDGRLDQEKYQQEFDTMLEYVKENSGKKKIIAVGNPPYQESDSGFGGSAKAIYNFFAESLMDCQAIGEFALVIPSRWFTTGKGASSFRERVTSSRNIKAIRHFKNSKSVFPTVDVLGGICFFHYQESYDGDLQFTNDRTSTPVNLSEFDMILDDPKGYDLVKKLQKNWDGKYVSELAWPVRPFAIRTNYFKKNKPLSDGHKDAIPCFTKRRKVLNASIKDIPKNLDKINEWQVAVPSAYAPGSKTGVRRVTLPANQYFIIPKGYITTETYNVVSSFKTKNEAENFKIYLMSDFARYFLGLRKVTQHIYKGQWAWVPVVNALEEWDDKKLFKKFKITSDEQKHIREMVKEWS